MTRPDVIKNHLFKHAPFRRRHTGEWFAVENHVVNICICIWLYWTWGFSALSMLFTCLVNVMFSWTKFGLMYYSVLSVYLAYSPGVVPGYVGVWSPGGNLSLEIVGLKLSKGCIYAFLLPRYSVKVLIVCCIITSLFMQSDVYFLDFCGFIFNMVLVRPREDLCILQLWVFYYS